MSHSPFHIFLDSCLSDRTDGSNDTKALPRVGTGRHSTVSLHVIHSGWELAAPAAGCPDQEPKQHSCLPGSLCWGPWSTLRVTLHNANAALVARSCSVPCCRCSRGCRHIFFVMDRQENSARAPLTRRCEASGLRRTHNYKQCCQTRNINCGRVIVNYANATLSISIHEKVWTSLEVSKVSSFSKVFI